MRRTFLMVLASCVAVAACGDMPNRRAEFRADCVQRAGTYQDEGGPDWAPDDAECLAPGANGTISEIEYTDD